MLVSRLRLLTTHLEVLGSQLDGRFDVDAALVGEQIAVWVAAGLAALLVLHRTLLSLLAGLALAVIRPYASGEPLRLHSPAHGGEVEAVIVRLGPLTTTLATETGLLCLPNHRLLMDAPQAAADR